MEQRPRRRAPDIRAAWRCLRALEPVAVRLARAATLVGVLGAVAPDGLRAQATLKGRVVVDSGGAPIPGAEILARGGEFRAQANSSGEFLLGGLPPGRVDVVARAIGFRQVSATLDLAACDTLELTFELRRAVPVLPPVEVQGARSSPGARLVDFDRRRALGLGSFLTRAQLAEWEDHSLSNALRRLTGVTLVPRPWACGGGFAVATGRGDHRPRSCDPKLRHPPACYLGVFLDGVRIYDAGEREPPNIDDYLTARIEAIELYRGAAQLPIEYQGTGTICGAILLWTRISGRR